MHIRRLVSTMAIKGIIDSWLEEGFLRFKGAPPVKSRYEESLIPTVTNDEGEIITPKPLFPMFLESVELDPNFLVEYLEVIENALRCGKDKAFLIRTERIKDGEGDLGDVSSRKKGLIPIEYDRKNIFLSKTVFSLFELPDHLVPKGSSDYDNVLTKNHLYQKALEFRKESQENFDDLCTQFGYVEKVDKQEETIPIIHKDKDTVVNAYQMKEHYHRKEVFVKSPPKTIQEYLKSRTKFRNYEEFVMNLGEHPSVLERLTNSLYVMEKTLNYNTYKDTILSYNNHRGDSEDIIPTRVYVQPKISLQFRIPNMRSDYRVTCIACNSKNPSIFVSGHGVLPSNEMEHHPRGMVLCWNVHKCEHPERIYHTEEAVTCVEFSKTKPYLVAAGMRYGLISVFDLHESDAEVNSNNARSKVRPNGTITSVRWMRKKYSLAGEPDAKANSSNAMSKARPNGTMRKTYSLASESELVLSVSMDGLIVTWTHGRSLEGSVLRSTRRGEGRQRRLVLATDAPATCVQINPNDQDVALVGTIEGQVLQMNFNDPADYVRVYDCHNGPLYDLQWSPVVEGVFTTCGSDGCMRVWETIRSKPCKTIRLPEPVLRIGMSNVRSTLFAVMTKRKLSIFDFSLNLHKPVVELEPEVGVDLTSVVFCPRNDWILLGHSDGGIHMYKIADVPESEMSQSDALKAVFITE